MRKEKLFINADASIINISELVTPDCGQDMRYLIVFEGENLDGTPLAYVEQTIDDDQIVFVPVSACADAVQITNTSATLGIGLQDNYFMGESLRVRILPNGNTTGTYSVTIAYKTKV